MRTIPSSPRRSATPCSTWRACTTVRTGWTTLRPPTRNTSSPTPPTCRRMRGSGASILPQYRIAAHAYEAGLAKNPYDRDALFNLSGLYYIVGDTAQALPVATRLYGLDPLNRSVLAKLAGAYQLRKKTDSTLYYLQQGELIPIEVTVGTFTTDEQGATVGGLLTNSRKKANDPFKLGFELLNAEGEAIASQSVDVPALQPGTNQQFTFKVAGQGIVGWRYKKA